MLEIEDFPHKLGLFDPHEPKVSVFESQESFLEVSFCLGLFPSLFKITWGEELSQIESINANLSRTAMMLTIGKFYNFTHYMRGGLKK